MVRHVMSRATRSRMALVILCALLTAAGLSAQVASAQSQFLFPSFVAGGEVNSGIAIFNPGIKDAVVTLTLVGTAGSEVAGVVNPVTLVVPALGQTARAATDLFGYGIIDASLRVSSPTSGLIVYYQIFNSDGTYSDGAGAPASGTTLVFPVVPGPTEGYSEIDLVNPNPRGTAVELSLWGYGGDLLGKGSVQVPAQGAYRGMAKDLFPAGTSFSGASHVTALTKPLNIFSQAQSVAGTSLFLGFSSVPDLAGRVDIAALNAQVPTQASNGGGIAHFKTGEEYASAISLANLEPASADVTVTAIANNGIILASRKVTLKANGGLRVPAAGLLRFLRRREGGLASRPVHGTGFGFPDLWAQRHGIALGPGDAEDAGSRVCLPAGGRRHRGIDRNQPRQPHLQHELREYLRGRRPAAQPLGSCRWPSSRALPSRGASASCCPR